MGRPRADHAVSVGGADADVAQAADVAESDGAMAVDAVMADAVLDAGLVGRGTSFDPCGEGGSRRPTVQCAMWAGVVVVAPEGVELGLEVGE